MSYAELATAAGQFDSSRIIGRGGFGPVYCGELRGRTVAVKKLNATGGHGA